MKCLFLEIHDSKKSREDMSVPCETMFKENFFSYGVMIIAISLAEQREEENLKKEYFSPQWLLCNSN